MKSFLIAIAALSLSGCTVAQASGVLGIPTPVEYSARTAVDEQVAMGIDNAYKAFRLTAELGVDTGLIKGERATSIRRANRCAYQAVRIFREAYQTANSADLLAAARSANIAIEQAIATAKGSYQCHISN